MLQEPGQEERSEPGDQPGVQPEQERGEPEQEERSEMPLEQPGEPEQERGVQPGEPFVRVGQRGRLAVRWGLEQASQVRAGQKSATRERNRAAPQ